MSKYFVSTIYVEVAAFGAWCFVLSSVSFNLMLWCADDPRAEWRGKGEGSISIGCIFDTLRLIFAHRYD